MERIESVLLPALDNVKTDGVVWSSVVKIVKYVSDSQRIEKELQYSLKRRLKSRDSAKILNTLTVYHTISLNCSLLVRQQLSERKSLQVFGKVFLRSRDSIIQHAILQLLMDWSFLFSKEALGDRSDQLLQKLVLREGKLPKPTMMVMKLQREGGGGGVLGTISRSFVRGFEFEYRSDQVVLEEDCNYKVSHSCRPTMHCRNFKFRAVKRIFSRANSRLLASSTRSPIVLELSTRPPQLEANIEELSLMVPSDCKKLGDLISEIQVLMTKDQWTDAGGMLYLAESLRSTCMDWKRKIVENVALRLHNETPLLDEEDDELRPMLFAKLLSLGEMLQTVLTSFEHVQRKCVSHFEDKHSEEQSEEEVDGNDDALSFVSARSASSTTSINFDSNEDLNWVIFSSKKDRSGDQLTCSGFVSFCSETEFETENNKPTIKSVPKPPPAAHSVTHPTKTGNAESAFAMSYSYTFGDLTPSVQCPPPSVISGGHTAASAAAASVLVFDNETPFCIPLHRTSHTRERKPSPFTFLSLEKRSRSFSELKSVRDQDLTSKTIITYPSFKVRSSDDYLGSGFPPKRHA